jgi:hypothetical protein
VGGPVAGQGVRVAAQGHVLRGAHPGRHLLLRQLQGVKVDKTQARELICEPETDLTEEQYMQVNK